MEMVGDVKIFAEYGVLTIGENQQQQHAILKEKLRILLDLHIALSPGHNMYWRLEGILSSPTLSCFRLTNPPFVSSIYRDQCLPVTCSGQAPLGQADSPRTIRTRHYEYIKL